MKAIPHSKPFIGREEIAAVQRVLRYRQLSQGREVDALERELSARVRHKYGVATSSGTASIYLALKALGVDKGHGVVIPSYVCTALLNAVNMVRAVPFLADVDPNTGNLTQDTVKKALRARTRAVIVPHLFGQPADVLGIAKLGIPIIEDSAQCVGGTIGKKPVGGLSVVSVFSFYTTKLLSAGEGGMVCTSSRKIADKVIELREYDNRDKYTPSFNFKLSDLHAAVARIQLKKLAGMVRRRKEIAAKYLSALYDSNLGLPTPWPGTDAVYFRFVVRTPKNREKLVQRLIQEGITCTRPIYKPLHQYLGKKGFFGADEIFNAAVSIPIYPALTHEKVNRVCQALKSLK